jgi:hypothetical protein
MVKMMYVPMNKFRRPETSPAGAHISGPRTKPRTKPAVTVIEHEVSNDVQEDAKGSRTHNICVNVVIRETASD